MAEGGVHPLLFPDVIRDILNFLPATDVESCRLVCRAWNIEACTVLRNKRVVVFLDPEAVRLYNNAMRNTQDFPHGQFEFCIQDFTGLVDENLREFWTTFGPHIRGLEFRQSHLFWRDFLDVIEQNVPNLEKVSFRHIPRNVLRSRNSPTERRQILSVKELRIASLPASQMGAVDRLTDLLRTLPNLEIIEFLPIKQATVKNRVSNLLIEILQKPEVSLPNLKMINLNLELSSAGLDALASKQFAFQTLQITLSNGVKATAFHDLMNSLQGCLTDLRVSFPDTFANGQSFITKHSMQPEECIQVLSKAKRLQLYNFKGSIKFVLKMPELETLELTTSNMAQCIPFGFKQREQGFSRYEDHKLRSLKIFPTSPGTEIAETLMLESISRCFPCLNAIHLQGVDDDGLGVIYRNLPFLSVVELVQAKCTDQGLTGIPLEICNDMLETSTYIVVQAEKYRRDLFIGSLQYLRRFSVDAPKISDASIALGLADCKNLRELKIGSPQISDTGVIFITDKFWKQLDFLDVSECTEITEQSKFYAGEKLVGKLKVADTTPEDLQAQARPQRKETVPNPNRGIIRVIRATSTVPCSGSGSSPTTTSTTTTTSMPSSHSKFLVEDTEFFEEHSEEELRDRGIGVLAVPQFPPERHRHRFFRIREALRRNGDFMRNLQRMGVQQFRRLYRRELQGGVQGQQDGAPNERALPQGQGRNEDPNPAGGDMGRHNHGFDFEEIDLMAYHRNLIEDGFPPPDDRVEEDDDEDDSEHDSEEELEVILNRRPVPVYERVDGPVLGADANAAAPPPPPAPVEAAAAAAAPAEPDGEDVDGQGDPDPEQPARLPEIHLAELFRLGLRPDDIEFWLRNRHVFENDNENERFDPPNIQGVLRAIRGDAIRAGINIAVEANIPGAPAVLGEDEDADLEAIRQVVLNAFGDDLPEFPADIDG